MSLKFATTPANNWIKNASVPTSAAAHTFFGRALAATGWDAANVEFRPFNLYNDTGSNHRQRTSITSGKSFVATAAGDTALKTIAVTSFVDDTWYDFAIANNGTGVGSGTAYFKPTANSSWDKTLTLDGEADFTSFGWSLGNYGQTYNIYVTVCHFRGWNSVLTSEQLLAEAASATPVITSNLYLDTRFAAGSLVSAVGNDWSLQNSTTVEAGAADPVFGKSHSGLLLRGVG
jgi:hypothetical protein